MLQMNNSAAADDMDDFSLAKTIQNMEGTMQEDTISPENVMDEAGENVVSGIFFTIVLRK